MVNNGVMSVVGWIGATATSVALVPQVIVSCCRMKCHMSQVSVNMLILNAISSSCTLLYAIHFGVIPIVFANAMCMLCTICLSVAKTVDYTRTCIGGEHGDTGAKNTAEQPVDGGVMRDGGK